MNEMPHQPAAAPLPEALLQRLLKEVAPGPEEIGEVRFHGAHSNDLAEVRLRDGRTLMVKRGRHPWAAERFETSRRAAALVRQHRAAVVPEPLPLPQGVDERPVEAYWRIARPTLAEIWPALSPSGQRRALRSWGRLIRRIHAVELQGYGPLGREPRADDLAEHLRADLQDRLLPAVYSEWPDAAWPLERLLTLLPGALPEGVGACLVHNDLHAGNVLCELVDGEPRCIGLLDLETAVAAPPESDLAIAELHHGALFGQPLPTGWRHWLREGYGREPDARVLAVYRASHLANLGFYSALVGHEEHAALVADALHAEVDALAGMAG